MQIIRSFVIAMTMFSRLPMPQFEWDAKSMRYSMAMFPLVGVFVGAVVVLWGWFCGWMGLNAFFSGVGFALLPVLVTGGVHMDGFCDTTDAISSRATRERRLEIMHDSHIGTFAVLGVVSYFLIYVALASEIMWDMPLLISFAFSFVFIRSLSGISVVIFPTARNSGLAKTFADCSSRKVSTVILFTLMLISIAGMMLFSPLAGAAMLVMAGIMFLVYYLVSVLSFGGITGDLAGWFLQLCELLVLAGVVIVQLLQRKGIV